jgi:hypothetical protein
MESGSKPFESQRVAIGCIVAAIVGLNFWVDYYHPVWLCFDAFILIVLIIAWIRKARSQTPVRF